MMFIFRAIFWLAVVSAILPPRGSNEAGLGEQAGRMVGAAMDYCSVRPGECVDGAMATAQAIRIPAEFVLRAQEYVATGSVPASVPVPQPRPASL
jgi:hypothetical protein